ncbi:MAG: NUDIX hydrolase [Balneola sp.]|jgi:8-oxo-dGTP diphosphatase|nr:NUDIX hydrolase [Balneola sp.]MBE78738.1 NUDIX hydrolase [Balneola sp.]|tara:strand:- start:1855 stop:2286 length:432 start_codon:yes stop_codon:yes gene_type:complete
MSDSFSNRLRVRSCGILVEDEKVLLIELFSPVTNKWTWIPPGGGVDFGESLEDALIREFKEETNLQISVGKRLHVNEVIVGSIHAIEFYHLVKREGGALKLGSDPEMTPDQQILRDIGFFTKEELQEIELAPDFLKSELWSLI